MNINDFITENYNYIKAIATNEYKKECNSILYKQYGCDDFISEVVVFLIKKYKTYDKTLCKVSTFIIKNCSFCAGELKARLKKSNRCIDLFTSNESDLITKDNNNNDLNAYENIGKDDYYKELSLFSYVTEDERRIIEYKIQGLEINEIAKLMGKSRQTIWRRFNIIKEKIMV